MENAGVWNRGWTRANLEKKRPSRACAKYTRGLVRKHPFSVPMIDGGEYADRADPEQLGGERVERHEVRDVE
jgi:hypothetical protein